MGIYDTLSTQRLDRLGEDEIFDAKEELGKGLCDLLDEYDICPERILVVGFGNKKLTPDSVGPKSAEKIKPTLHISEEEPEIFDDLECSEIAVICPGVSATCGIDSSVTVRTIAEQLMPDVIFAIDSIMTTDPKRLGSTFQLSGTGLFPGGVGNLRSPITKATMGAPVIGIGVPTVIDCRAITKSFEGDDHFFISPREIDEITNVAAEIISGAINQVFGFDLQI